jgi:hypothetical protein
MGMKEKFMENMMNQMSFTDKKEMMNEMMGKFFAGMTEDEKKELMKEMMGKMMGGMMGSGGAEGKMANPMMGMMGMMMGKKEGEAGFNPMEMCKKMMAGMGQNRNVESFATPEIQALFEEWARQMDSEVISLIESGKKMDINDMAAHLKISSESLIYFLARLARQGKIDLQPAKK